MEVVEVIESVLSDAIAYGFDPFDEEQRRELSENIVEELRPTRLERPFNQINMAPSPKALRSTALIEPRLMPITTRTMIMVATMNGIAVFTSSVNSKPESIATPQSL